MTETFMQPDFPDVVSRQHRDATAPFHRHRRSFASLRTIVALILREMATTYGRSPGGYLWAVLEPVGGILILSIIFTLALPTPALGNNFQLFYATGVLPLSIFTGISGRLAQAVNFSKPLLAYPSVTFLDAILARFILNMLTQIMVCYIIFTGILVSFNTQATLAVGSIAGALGLAGALALGVGTLNCFLFSRFPVWQQAWGVLMRPMFLISCVFMVFDRVPRPLHDWLWFNPVVHVVGLMRHGFYPAYHATYVSVSYVLAISGLCFTMGLFLLQRHKYSLLNR